MENILEKIKAQKIKEVAEQKALYPVRLLEQSKYYNSPTLSLKNYLQREDKSGIIAEFKRKSPSKPNINLYAEPEEITIGYMQSGASALSVLTDHTFFGGSSKDLQIAREFNYCPILRKDFIIDSYQIIESRSMGADVILLIAAILTKDEIINFTDLAHSLGLEVLLELHSEEELSKYYAEVDVVGINNRNLKTFEVSLENSIQMRTKLPQDHLVISESGITCARDIQHLKSNGFDGFLIGELFMKTSDPAATCRNLIMELKNLEKKYELVKN